MLKIWGRANSVNVQKAVWATAETGVAFERVDAGMAFGKNNEDWYLELNPNGKIPLLQHEGFSLWESNVIVRYLCQTFSMGKLCPEEVELRFLAEQWMDWTVSELGPAMHPVFWGLVRTPPEKRNQQAIESGIKACIIRISPVCTSSLDCHCAEYPDPHRQPVDDTLQEYRRQLKERRCN